MWFLVRERDNKHHFLCSSDPGKCIEQQIPLYQVFVDLTKTFDTVNREALWKILGKLRCSPTFIHMQQQLYRDMKAVSGTFSDKISFDNEVKQGDVLVPTLFSIDFAVLLIFAFNDCDTGIYLRLRTSGKERRFDPKTKTLKYLFANCYTLTMLSLLLIV